MKKILYLILIAIIILLALLLFTNVLFEKTQNNEVVESCVDNDPDLNPKIPGEVVITYKNVKSGSERVVERKDVCKPLINDDGSISEEVVMQYKCDDFGIDHEYYDCLEDEKVCLNGFCAAKNSLDQ